MDLKKAPKFYLIFEILLISVVFLTILFGRSFMGLNLFGFRLGELIIGFGLILSLLLSPILLKFYKFTHIEKTLNVIMLIIFSSFFITVIISRSSLFNLYTYKSSSYFWSLGFIYIGYLYYKFVSLEKFTSYILVLSLPMVYILSTTYFPSSWMAFFGNYSDKFDFVKGSDLLLSYIIVCLFLRINNKPNLYTFTYFMISSGVFIPLLMYKSKGSFISIIIFFTIELFNYKHVILKNYIKSFTILIMSILFFVLSTFQVWGDLTFNKNMADQETLITEINTKKFITKLSDTVELKTDFMADQTELFYVQNNRLYSSDYTVNWRLQIWQDVFIDSKNNNDIIFGYGYKGPIQAMLAEGRDGMDNQNEHVHNYFITIFARGGIFHTVLFSYLFYKIIKIHKHKSKNYSILIYLLPVFFAASFDSAMESVRFPLLFYIFGSYFFFKLNQPINGRSYNSF